jgi:hypothetical protein
VFGDALSLRLISEIGCARELQALISPGSPVDRPNPGVASDLPSQDRVLVAKHQHLHVFGRTGTGEECHTRRASQPPMWQHTR